MTAVSSSNGGGRTLNLSMRDVKSLLTMADCIPIQEEVFRRNGEGTAWNGPNAWVFADPQLMTHPGTGKMMCGGVEPDWWGMKLLGTREGGPDDRNRMQLLALFRAETLLPVAVMEANYLGHVRTGAGAAIATKYLARRDARTIGVLGAGATARFALLAHHALGWPVEKVYIYSRSPENRQAYVEEMGAQTGFSIEALDGPEEVVRRAEILITGTGSPAPALKADWVQPGTHVNAVPARAQHRRRDTDRNHGRKAQRRNRPWRHYARGRSRGARRSRRRHQAGPRVGRPDHAVRQLRSDRAGHRNWGARLGARKGARRRLLDGVQPRRRPVVASRARRPSGARLWHPCKRGPGMTRWVRTR
jgi:ornithine cyclodeaminase/alanine dehydrogenase-like protein (mu-crystallin family)